MATHSVLRTRRVFVLEKAADAAIIFQIDDEFHRRSEGEQKIIALLLYGTDFIKYRDSQNMRGDYMLFFQRTMTLINLIYVENLNYLILHRLKTINI
jgi:hypothetical protein